MPFPESVQALIAARLDTLEPEAKSMLADAAVIGKVSGPGQWQRWATATCNRDHHSEGVVAQGAGQAVEAVVDGGRAEYAFWHVLARDVPQPAAPRLPCSPSRRCRLLDRVESA